MYLICIILFLIMPFFSIPFIIFSIYFDRKHAFIYGILLSLIFSIVSYNFIPDIEHDLYRYFVEMKNYYSLIPFTKFLSTIAFSNTKFIFVLLQYIISHIGNFHILPFLITFIGYNISFYIILDFSKFKKFKPLSTIIILVFFISVFHHFIFMSNLAQYLAVSTGFLAFYLEYIKDKKQKVYKILYIIPMFIHLSMIIIPIIRLLLNIDINKYKYIYFSFLMIYCFFPVAIFKVLDFIPGFGILATKINNYIVMGDRKLYTSYDYLLLVLLLFIILISYLYRKIIKKYISEKFCNMTILILSFNVFSIFYRDIFSRILNLSLLCFCIFLYIILNKCSKKNLVIILVILLIFILLFGSIMLNVFSRYNFNGIFNNLNENIFYYFRLMDGVIYAH